MLALALKVCTQRMFIISEAHQSAERKEYSQCLGRHIPCLFRREYNLSRNAKVRENDREMEQLLSNAKIFTKRKGIIETNAEESFTEHREYKEKVRVKLDKASHGNTERGTYCV